MVKNRQKESALDQTADSSYDYKEDKISPWKSNKDDQTVDSASISRKRQQQKIYAESALKSSENTT